MQELDELCQQSRKLDSEQKLVLDILLKYVRDLKKSESNRNDIMSYRIGPIFIAEVLRTLSSTFCPAKYACITKYILTQVFFHTLSGTL